MAGLCGEAGEGSFEFCAPVPPECVAGGVAEAEEEGVALWPAKRGCRTAGRELLTTKLSASRDSRAEAKRNVRGDILTGAE